METENVEVRFTIPIPIDRPNRNGVVYTKEAIEKIIDSFNDNRPITYGSGNDLDCKVVGVAKLPPNVIWDDEHQICKMIIDGIVFNSGIEYVINEIDDGKIKDFRITGVGLK